MEEGVLQMTMEKEASVDEQQKDDCGQHLLSRPHAGLIVAVHVDAAPWKAGGDPGGDPGGGPGGDPGYPGDDLLGLGGWEVGSMQVVERQVWTGVMTDEQGLCHPLTCAWIWSTRCRW